MFESLKIINECKKILKNHDIKYKDDFRIYKKLGLIHCKVDDWRGPIEVDGFPVLTVKSAVSLLIEHSSFEHYITDEKEKRETLIKEYPLGYGEYEPRKYIFENILQIIKSYDKEKYINSIKKYTKFINTNNKTKQKWMFNNKTEKFELYPTCNYSAVIINKAINTIRIYNQDPCGGRLDDNIYKLLTEDYGKGLFKFSFTNNGEDRFYLEIYNPQYTDGSDNYIMINKADKVVLVYLPNENYADKTQIRTFVFNGTILKITGDISFISDVENK